MTGDATDAGIVPRAVSHLFDAIHSNKFEQCLVRVSYCEIYNEEVRDLLGGKLKERLEVREDAAGSPYVKNLTWLSVRHRQEISQALEVSNTCEQCIASINDNKTA